MYSAFQAKVSKVWESRFAQCLQITQKVSFYCKLNTDDFPRFFSFVKCDFLGDFQTLWVCCK